MTSLPRDPTGKLLHRIVLFCIILGFLLCGAAIAGAIASGIG